MRLRLTPDDNVRLADFCGVGDANLAEIERYFQVSLYRRGHEVAIDGDDAAASKAAAAIRALYAEADQGPMTAQRVRLACLHADRPSAAVVPDAAAAAGVADADADAGVTRVWRTPKAVVSACGRRQMQYFDQLARCDLVFGVGPAGTGKTYLAVAAAVAALSDDRVSRIVLTRPAVEAGERLGFLPGDLAQKVDPYLRPLYDALYEMLGVDAVGRFVDRGVIEIAPLAYMRGRTLEDAWIILDEAQNTTPLQMKMVLTRLGFGSRLVVTGDLSQVDLPQAQPSGLAHALRVLGDLDGIGMTRFSAADVVRHPLVERIIRAYRSQQREADDDAAP